LNKSGELLAHFFCIDIAELDEGEIVGTLARFL